MDKFIYLIIAIAVIEAALLIYIVVAAYISHNKTKQYRERIEILYERIRDLTEERCLRCMHSEVDDTGVLVTIWCDKYQVVGTEIEKCRPELGRKD